MAEAKDLRDQFREEFGIDYFDPRLTRAVEAVGRYRDKQRASCSSVSLREEVAIVLNLQLAPDVRAAFGAEDK